MRSTPTLLLLASTACVEALDESNPILSLQRVPAFSLEVYPTGELLGPDDHLGHAAVYYFGHAT
ncbi:MAG TPA: hypothetical protein ENK18_08815 [Deltaproteobacteria bacterium]|nr:hypothetical protein [Deltaproteobacteria bacterium]